MIELIFPFGAGACLLLLAAWKQWTEERVPNSLIGLFLLGAVGTATCASAGLLPSLRGGIAESAVGFAVGGGLLLPFYSRKVLGAGCVKAQAVFGAWVGCALPLGACVVTTLTTTLGAVLLTSIIAGLCYLIRSEEARRKYLFPAQVTLSFGSLFVLVVVWVSLT